MTLTHRFKVGRRADPEFLVIEMDRQAALGIIIDLASQLRTTQKLFRLDLRGKLKIDNEDEEGE